MTSEIALTIAIIVGALLTVFLFIASMISLPIFFPLFPRSLQRHNAPLLVLNLPSGFSGGFQICDPATNPQGGQS